MHEHYGYTKDELKKNLVLLEGHGKSNPCPECVEKHLLNIEGLSEEGTLMTQRPEERQMFFDIAEWARNTRRKLSEVD